MYAPTPSDFDVLVRESRERRIDPLDVALVLFFESAGFNPASVRRKKDGVTFNVGGLNQMSAANLHAYGIEPEEWITRSAAAQLPTIFRFWDSLVRGFAGGAWPTDETHLEALNFVPAIYKASNAATMPHAVLSTPGDGRYEFNTPLDPKGTGAITLDTIRAMFAELAASSSPRWAMIRDGVRDAMARVSPTPPPASMPIAVAALGVALLWAVSRGRSLLVAALAAAVHGGC